jgi:hypothetical protein
MEINIAKRTIRQATLSPIDFKEREGVPTLPDPGRPPIERAVPLRAFRPTKDEIAGVLFKANNAAYTAILEAVSSRDPSALIAAVNEHDPDGTVVPAIYGLLKNERKTRIKQAREVIHSWIEKAEEQRCIRLADSVLAHIHTEETKSEPLSGTIQANKNGQLAATTDLRDSSDTTEPKPPAGDGSGGGEGAPEPLPHEQMRRRLCAAIEPRLHGPCSPGGRLVSLLASGICPDETLTNAMAVLGVADPAHLDEALKKWDQWETELEQMPALPASIAAPQAIGYLHLERLSFVPSGVEHGELIYSIPLAPGEFISITHKEWSNTEEEFHRIISDQFEDYSEQGVVNTTDMSQATTAESQHSSAFNVAVTISGGYGPVSGTISSSYAAESSASESKHYTLNRAQSITKKASARTRKEHKISFRLAKKTGEEDQTIRLIKNPDPFNPVRYDYYQLMRKWRVNLHRYGVRLTYDLTIPEPAHDLLGPYIELNALNTLLEKGFVFDVNPNYVNRANYLYYQTKYGVSIDPPPPLMVSVQAMKLSGPWAPEEKSLAHVDELHVAAPEGYKYYSDHSAQWHTYYDDAEAGPDVKTKYPHGDPGVTSNIGYMVFGDNVSSIITTARVWFILQEDHERAWQAKAYEAIRDAAHKDYLEKRQILQERRDRILAELAKTDALTLRRREREELMKGVLRWLFGPSLRFTPAGVPASYYDQSTGAVIDESTQAAVLEHGALISFLHQAIEWENINSFLYPYFWTPRDRWNERLSLRHDDPFHESFLRAGAARVVLPIRPGWEKAFLSVLKTGKVDGLDGNDDVYLTIAEEIENYAKTNYPGIIPANPADIDPEKATQQGEGILIGSWYEYSPTSAVDIKIGETGPAEGEYRPTTFNPTAPWAKVSQIFDGAAEVLKALASKLSSNQP